MPCLIDKYAMDRYERQMIEIGSAGQAQLCAARVLIVGVGGLGSAAALYLAGAGVGTIGLVDDDCVNITNLHRQVLYAEADIGRRKVDAAAERLHSINSEVVVEPYAMRLDTESAERVVGCYDVVIDGTDNYYTRYLLDEVCCRLGIPYIYGAIRGFEGQVSLFDRAHGTGRYSDLYPTSDEPSAEEYKGVVGPVAAVVGAVEASEALKVIAGCGTPLYGRLWSIDLRTMRTMEVEL